MYKWLPRMRHLRRPKQGTDAVKTEKRERESRKLGKSEAGRKKEGGKKIRKENCQKR